MSAKIGKESIFMKACIVKKYGKENTEILDISQPLSVELKEGQVLVKIHAVALNAVDWKTRAGKIKAASGDPSNHSPLVLGYDFSGVVESVGPSVSQWVTGDAVFGVSVYGALASYRIVYADMIARKPVNISHGEAASLVTAGLTALQMLDWAKAHAPKLDKVIISGGAGGTGHLAIQLAKRVFNISTVITTCSDSKAALMRELGADVIVDRAATDFTAAVGAPLCDAALDITGEDKKLRVVTHKAGNHSMVVSVVAPGGGARIPSGRMLEAIFDAYHMGPGPGCCILGLLNCLTDRTVETLVMLPRSSDLMRIAQYASEGLVKVVVDRVYPFEQAIQAVDYVELGHVTGKCIVELEVGATAGLTQRNPL